MDKHIYGSSADMLTTHQQSKRKKTTIRSKRRWREHMESSPPQATGTSNLKE